MATKKKDRLAHLRTPEIRAKATKKMKETILRKKAAAKMAALDTMAAAINHPPGELPAFAAPRTRGPDKSRRKGTKRNQGEGASAADVRARAAATNRARNAAKRQALMDVQNPGQALALELVRLVTKLTGGR